MRARVRDVEIESVRSIQMWTMVCVERELNVSRLRCRAVRKFLTQRETHGGKAKRVFVAAKLAGSGAFVVAESGERGVIQRDIESEIDPPHRNVGRPVMRYSNGINKGIARSEVTRVGCTA